MFNLVIEPVTSTSFNIKPLDQWYLDGTARDVTQYVDVTDIEINKPKLYKRIDFSYEETETILNSLASRGHANVEVSSEGQVLYMFPDFLDRDLIES